MCLPLRPIARWRSRTANARGRCARARGGGNVRTFGTRLDVDVVVVVVRRRRAVASDRRRATREFASTFERPWTNVEKRVEASEWRSRARARERARARTREREG